VHKVQIDINVNLFASLETKIVFVSAMLRYGLSRRSW